MPVLTLHDGKATLQVQDGGQSVTFDLAKASLPEARRQLQDLTFGLVEQLQMLEKRLEGAAGVLERAWADGSVPVGEAKPPKPWHFKKKGGGATAINTERAGLLAFT